MKDSLGAPQSLLLLGGTSDIALAVARRLIRARLRRVVLAGRPSPRMESAAESLRSAGAPEVEVVEFDGADVKSHEAALGKVFDAGDIDVVVLAFGLLGDQAELEENPLSAAELAQVNYVGAMSSGLICANRLKAQGHGSLVVLSSVAGEKARRSNFIYGSTKAGLDAFAQGLGDALHGSGAEVLVVRPGFVKTKMTEGLPDAPLATTPEAVADAIIRGLRKGSATIWVPGAFRYVMMGLKMVPRPIFRKLPI